MLRAPTVYFAHSLADYGAPRARDALLAIRRTLPYPFRVRDPERLPWARLEAAWGRLGAYAAAVRPCAGVVALAELGADTWTRGVQLELAAAIRLKIPAFGLELGNIPRFWGIFPGNVKCATLHEKFIVFRPGRVAEAALERRRPLLDLFDF